MSAICIVSASQSRATIERWKHVLWNVHIEDMRRGVHEHLMFGEGEINFSEALRRCRRSNIPAAYSSN